MFGRRMLKTETTPDYIGRLQAALDDADAVVIGAGAGLSTSAGFTYSGERFQTYFYDFAKKYGFRDMYSGGFYPYETLEEYWAYWSRYIYINRYMNVPKPVYENLYTLIRDKDYFVLTTNVDHCFQKAGFDKHRLFYTQGDYGLLQCSEPCHPITYENETMIRDMLKAQGYEISSDSMLTLPDGATLKRTIPSDLVPHCPNCGKPMTMNLRCDDTFVQDEGWYQAANRYDDFIRRHKGLKVLYLELGVGMNTPGIIKYGFQRMTAQNPEATYVCINDGQAYTLNEISDRSIVINGDAGEVILKLKFLPNRRNISDNSGISVESDVHSFDFLKK